MKPSSAIAAVAFSTSRRLKSGSTQPYFMCPHLLGQPLDFGSAPTR
jgi:hypothetical protein